VQIELRALASGINMQIKSKVNNTDGKTFKMSSKWKPESRILNSAFAVYYCVLNQRTQIAQIVIHTMCTHTFMDKHLAVTVFLQTCLVENATESIPGKKQFAKSRMLQIEECKYVYFIYTFVTLTF